MNQIRNSENIGYWRTDAAELPAFSYTGKLPYREVLPDGRAVKLPEDPWFILGNNAITLFTHVSGEYELITGQRAWGRCNQGNMKNSGSNSAVLSVLEEEGWQDYLLAGKGSVPYLEQNSERISGCGFTFCSCRTGDILTERNLSVCPSENPREGTSAFLLTVSFTNLGKKSLEIRYQEEIGVNYTEIQYQTTPEPERRVIYRKRMENVDRSFAICRIDAAFRDGTAKPSRTEPCICELYPPAVFMKLLSENGTVLTGQNALLSECSLRLSPGESSVLRLVIGFSMSDAESDMEALARKLSEGAFCDESLIQSAFSSEWRRVLPSFPDEADPVLRRELIWHTYSLLAMATYSEFFGETKIPQGTIYDYSWGSHASARDHFQHALPLVYSHPDYAKSVLRYMIKRTAADGEIQLIERGSGYASHERYFTSDQQLFFFLLFTEYLRVTEDYDFLQEETSCYPLLGGASMRVIDLAEAAFRFLRDEVSVGTHGLIRLLNSDWNDAVYYIVKAPYNLVLFQGESHMNSAMASGIFQNLLPVLRKAEHYFGEGAAASELRKFENDITVYRKRITEAFLQDMGDRTFPRRMYFNGRTYGEDNMFLEPQGYTLWIGELSPERRLKLYQEMQKRVYAGEKLGAREQETPEFEDADFDKGSRENGGFWWALNGPVIIGMADLDLTEAKKLLRNMTMQHYMEAFPKYWSSYWSAADQAESSLIPEEGLPDQSLNYADIPIVCAHPHAWILYCYYYIKERERNT